MTDLVKRLSILIGIGLVILFTIIFLSESIFGDLTEQDSLKPLFVAVPIIAAVMYFIIKQVNKK